MTDHGELARRETTNAIADAVESGDHRLIDAPPTFYKSTGARDVIRDAPPWTQFSYLTARWELYHQFADWCEAEGISYYILPVFHRHCPTASGEHGKALKQRVQDWYRRGASVDAIHDHADVPCNGDCEYAERSEYDPDEYRVLIGHWTQAYSPKVRMGRNLVFDEFPGDSFTTRFSDSPNNDHAPLVETVTTFLQEEDGLPFGNFADLLGARDSPPMAVRDYFDGEIPQGSIDLDGPR